MKETNTTAWFQSLEKALGKLAAIAAVVILLIFPLYVRDFYFDIFKLGNWFDINKVVYDNGTFPGKPAPDIFLIASSKLGLDPSECLVVEDAFSGIKAARKANIGKIMAIDPFGKNAELFAENNMCKDCLIKDFTNFFEVSKEFK